MTNNKKQIEDIPGEKLPVVSDDKQVQNNSMRLYVYLISVSKFNGRNKPRFFLQGDFSINKIHKILGMHEATIKKYWKILEDEGLIKYEGQGIKEHSQAAWNKLFMDRKKNSTGYYTIPKKDPYKIIPRETLDKMINGYEVNEDEIKIYLLLANMQERFVYLTQPERIFSLKDLRELLSYSTKKNKDIILGLQWLRELGLIDYECVKRKSNLGDKSYVYYFKLISVNFYTDGGRAYAMMQNDTEVLPSNIKDSILEDVLVSLEGEESKFIKSLAMY